ncbi:MAG TPA: magnesium transporter CorA family protein [Polyangiaceae bacterium]|nr:magnesium transporter CorA family protein [Polyangiaceae bacterium]
MLRSLILRDGAAPSWVEGEAAARPPKAAERLWVDVEAPTPFELALLGERFGLHPVAIDDCGRIDLRPKLEEYERQLFVVLHRLVMPADAPDRVGSIELHAFLGERYLITIHTAPLDEVKLVRERLASDAALRERSLVHAYYLVCERVAYQNFDELDRLFESIETIEDSVLKQEDEDALPELFAAKRKLATARRMIVPQREVISLLLESGTPFIDERARPYFRRVLDVLMRMAEAVDTQREILSNVLDAHLSIVSNRTNAIMKSLTLLSAIFLPLSFVTGFFGQNFSHLPFDNVVLMWLGLGLCLALPVVMLLWFRSRKWL